MTAAAVDDERVDHGNAARPHTCDRVSKDVAQFADMLDGAESRRAARACMSSDVDCGEYKLPTIRDVPPLRTVLVRAGGAQGPFGAKMAGELSNTGVAPAIANAVFDAVGVRLNRFPITAERVYDALHSGD